MRKGRVKAVRQVEGPKPSGPPTQIKRARSAPALRPPSLRVRELRRLGLSVSADATDRQLDELTERFELANDYARAVYRRIAKATVDDGGPGADRFNHFVAQLLDDGRLAEAIAARQRQRAQDPQAPLHTDRVFKRVAGLLGRQFPEQISTRAWIIRIFQRLGKKDRP